MTLKSLIQRLLDSRTTPSEAAHSAMPSSSYVTVTATAIQAWGEMAKGVATFDGFVRVSARATSSNANVRVTNDTAAMFSQIEATASGQTQGVFVPVAKGDSWSVFGTNRDNPVVRVVKAIGEGYNCFVRRALSCLRALSLFSPRSFCKAKNLGFQNNQLLLSIRALIFLAQAPRISLPTPHRATAGRLLGAIQLQSQLLKSKSRTGRWHLLPYLTETLRELESVVTLKKGHRLSSCVVAGVQPIILFGSTRQVQTFNPLTGGALC